MCGIQSAERPVESECGALAVGAKITVGVPKAIALLQGLTPLCVRLAVVCPFDGGVRHHGRLLAVPLSSLSDERLKIAFHKLMGLPTLYQLVCQVGVDSAHGHASLCA